MLRNRAQKLHSFLREILKAVRKHSGLVVHFCIWEGGHDKMIFKILLNENLETWEFYCVLVNIGSCYFVNYWKNKLDAFLIFGENKYAFFQISNCFFFLFRKFII